MYKIALFASGSGTNVENIANYFHQHSLVQVSLVLSNKKDAFVLERVKRLGIPSMVFNREQFYQTSEIVNTLVEHEIDWVVLAGFLWLIPSELIDAFPQRIINIHPALLPKYGGRGLYGNKVHQAVVAHRETVSGITIHYVNEHYDTGNIIFQAKVEVLPTDSPEDVARKVHQLEYEHFPKVIEKLVLGPYFRKPRGD
ncbi:MAG TPA: phosphoribosylglycinamide formyltransferase [Marinilabiliales bacterium]|nr:MAG: phosphoribosylglycinamide formyltransferase [Bacteroidetes bacterium GWA2_40_14]OFX61551.1 MAG: phosphoribosylglycinamide formyltransferase [Bacteroidetes bacterium GWC2_40_13]OFX73573.1 MAG: phosphoribosylglycinamide formyltransferase [Bacteroidetes bacterium GWD2_40_43]OFX90752.1 MAG: phosphoribosylglycinamide formyltransferase [Bacteroidetes bacterium GWE2_40_63]OFY20616.1 MAG: phosphoribosylglycinamide formyltransferase [Bacteroidetes bacterium GWF2_40_13]OFZ24669.1 MAG: phosphorib